MAVTDWSITADDNIAIDDINIGEHCPLHNINDALRAIMAAMRAYQIANDAAVAKKAPINSPVLTGTPKAPTPAANDDSTRIATTEWVNDALDAASGAFVAEQNKVGNHQSIRFVSGLQISWGWHSVAAGSANTGREVTFSKAFSAEPILLLSPRPGSATTLLYNVIAYPRTATGFTAYLNTASGHTNGNFSYFAIGEWA